MTEGKRQIIRQLLQEYDAETVEDIQDALNVFFRPKTEGGQMKVKKINPRELTDVKISRKSKA